jgi:hypothetical protein
VDDSSVACIAGRRVFEQMGFQTHVKLGGIEALDFISGNDPCHVGYFPNLFCSDNPAHTYNCLDTHFARTI